MSRRIIIWAGVLVFAIGLAAIIGSRLPGETLGVALGIALGIIIGVPIGMLSVLIGQRSRQAQSDSSAALMLTPDQADALLKALERPQVSPESFPLPPRQERQFSVVGGADVPDTPDDPP